MESGHLYTVAGDGTQGFSAGRRAGHAAELNSPIAVAVDHAGNLLIGDTENYRIRRLTG